MGLPVPYPVQVNDTEILMEFIGVPGGSSIEAAPRLAQVRAGRVEQPLRRCLELRQTQAVDAEHHAERSDT